MNASATAPAARQASPRSAPLDGEQMISGVRTIRCSDTTPRCHQLRVATEAVRRGTAVILGDVDTGVGYLYVAAEHADAAALNLMVKRARGIVCLCLTERRCRQLGLELLGPHDPADIRTSLTVSFEARQGVTTGISAADRAHTIGVAISAHASPRDIVVPGHVIAHRALAGGILARASYVEAAVDFARLADCKPAGVICQILSSDGTNAGPDELRAISAAENIPLAWITEIFRARADSEPLVEHVGSREMTVGTSRTPLLVAAFRERFTRRQHFAITATGVTEIHNVHILSPQSSADEEPFGCFPISRTRELEAVIEEVAGRGDGLFIYSGEPPDSDSLSSATPPYQEALVRGVVAALGIRLVSPSVESPQPSHLA